jgi:ABC-2 type transport system permease protein
VQNGLAIAFPAWIAIGASRARGIDAMGQRMIMMAGNMIVLALSILPGVIVAAIVVFVVYFLTHTIIFVVPALTVALVIIAECWFAVEALGRLLDRTDVNAVDARE